jgi:hypothetical protein
VLVHVLDLKVVSAEVEHIRLVVPPHVVMVVPKGLEERCARAEQTLQVGCLVLVQVVLLLGNSTP